MTMRYNSGGVTPTDKDNVDFQSDASGNLKVSIAANPAGGTDQDVNLIGLNGVAPSVGAGVVGTGTLRVTLPTDGTGALASVGGQVAASAVASGNPLTIGARARTTQAGQVSDTQVQWAVCQSDGRLVTKPYQIAELEWQYAAASGGISNTTTAVTIKAAAGASVRNYITAIQIEAEALGAATELAIRDGAAGTVIWRIKIGTGGLLGGLPITFPTPLKGTANTLLEVVTLTASVTGAVYFNAQGFTAP